jgi:hypothetical protein
MGLTNIRGELSKRFGEGERVKAGKDGVSSRDRTNETLLEGEIEKSLGTVPSKLNVDEAEVASWRRIR